MSYADLFVTDFGKHLFYQSPLPKDRISPEMLLEITEAFCTREACTLVEIDMSLPESAIVSVNSPHLSLEFYDEWNTSFKNQGYDAPVLDVTLE